MAEVYKVLGQVTPAPVTSAALYSVPALTKAVISTIIVCNRAASATTFRVSIRVSGEADNVKQYIYYDVPIPPNDTFASTIGITLNSLDEIWVYAGNSNLSFSIFGTEIT